MLKHEGSKYIEDKNFIMRKFEINDYEDMYNNWASSSSITKYLTWDRHSSMDLTKIIIKMWINMYNNDDYYHWCIVYKENNEVIGSITLYNIDDINESCEIGYVLSEKYQNKGIMTKAIKKVLNYCFNEVGFNRVSGKCMLNNIQSMRVLKKNGFIYEGIMRSVLKNKNDEFVDCKTYAIIKKEYF